MSTQVVPVREQRLTALRATISGEHAATIEALGTALDHAVRCGDALIEAKGLVAPGAWGTWLDEHVNVSRQIASGYMRLAAFQNSLDPGLSITSNLALLRGLPAQMRGTPRLPAGVREEALRMFAAGGSLNEIARALGTTRDTVRKWTNPDWAEGRQARLNEDARTRRASAARARRSIPAKPSERETPEMRLHRLATSYGEPGRAAIGRAVVGLAKVQTREATAEALEVLIAVATMARRRLLEPGEG